MPKFTSIYNANRDNIGDWYSSPYKYFDLPGNYTTIWQLPITYNPPHKIIIYGGGGLLGQMRPLTPATTKYKQMGYKQIAWGLGDHSFISLDEQSQYIPELPVTYPSYLRNFDMIGIRDYYPELYSLLDNCEWVPCVSCMDNAFDKQYEIKHKVVFYEHTTLPLNFVAGMPKETFDFPTMTNGEKDMDKVIEHLASGEVIVTNSFHGALWGLFLGRKVIAFPWCSKFYGLKHRPFFCRPHEWLANIDNAISHPDSLKECREANMNFYKKVLDFVGDDE